MKLVGLFVFFGVILLTLQGVSSSFCFHYEYSSPASNYTKIGLRERLSQPSWPQRCKDLLGDGWDLARIDDEREYNFINQAHLADYNKLRYLIGGGTNELPSVGRLSQNYGFNETELIGGTGLHIYATTFFGELGFLSGIDSSSRALCEKRRNQSEGLTFSLDTSEYQKLVLNNNRRLSFSDWDTKCRELEGGGWAAAVIETRRELDFIGAAQRYFGDNRSYWIGGYTSGIHRRRISPCSIDNSGTGSNRIVMVPRNNGNNFELIALHPGQRRRGILCERPKSEA